MVSAGTIALWDYTHQSAALPARKTAAQRYSAFVAPLCSNVPRVLLAKFNCLYPVTGHKLFINSVRSTGLEHRQLVVHAELRERGPVVFSVFIFTLSFLLNLGWAKALR